VPCPCCGLRTLDRGDYEICYVCWWEDDGRDNADATDESGANGGISLAEARFNYLTTGIYDPARSDLRDKQESPERYARGREFVIDADGTLREPATGWSWKPPGGGPASDPGSSGRSGGG
jgi:hypothetical protein